MKKRLKRSLICLVVLLSIMSVSGVYAQLPPNLSNVKSSDISDDQLRGYLQKASSNGLTDSQIEQELKKRGMQFSEMDLIRARINQIRTQNVASTSQADAASEKVASSPVARTTISTSLLATTSSSADNIFGAELFSNPSLTFEPDLRIPTPKNYTLGADDKLLLDVYGVNLSQQSLEISPEGTVSIRYVGPVYVNGLTIEEALQRIKSKLVKIYPAINSGGTNIQLTLTNIRSIKIILIGAVKKPGAYTLSSLATLFNALFISGGPAENGSYRNIELIRNNKVILIADLYEFLLKANQESNVRLRDNDVIRIPFIKTKVNLKGEVNRSGTFEVQPNEKLADVIYFAGGFKSTAYKARVIGTRLTDFDKRVIDITKDSISSFIPQDGDAFTIGNVIERYQNQVEIAGTVFKPGVFSFEKGMTLKELLQKAEGLKEDAYVGRAIVVRTRGDLSKEYISTNLSDSSTSSFILNKDDIVQVLSIFDIKDRYTVSINGAVRKPGSYPFDDSLTLKSLLLQAGGFADNATGIDIEISRRKKDVDVNDPNSPIVEIIHLNDTKDLSSGSVDVTLKPFDIVSIKIDPRYKMQINVSVNGEVMIPGTYSLVSRIERISDLVKRAGGLLYTANVSGARLRRRNNIYDVDLQVVKKIAESSAKDSSGVTFIDERKAYDDIAIDLPKILASPGSKEDILLEEGDAIYVPVQNNLVSVSGEVFKPLEISYEEAKTLKTYIADAGGITSSANKKRIFVIYPNGKAARIKHSFIFFKKYPAITAGTKIFIPKQPEKKPADIARMGIIVSAISALITAVALAYQISKP